MISGKLHTWYGKVISLMLVLLWMGVISGFSAQNGEESSELSMDVSEWVTDTYSTLIEPEMTEAEADQMAIEIEPVIRKLAHMTEYAALSLLVLACLNCFEVPKYRKLLTILICLIYASADEIHQLFVQDRSGRFPDVCIDTMGAILAMLVVFLIKSCYDTRNYKSGMECPDSDS